MYGYGPSSLRQEVSFFVGGGVQVTTSRFVVFGQMYPIAGITSVAPFTVRASRVGLIAGAVLFGVLSLAGLPSMFQNGNPFAFLLFSALAALCGWRAIARKDVHGVIIATAGLQVRALTSPNVVFVQQVLGALHQAIATR